MTVYRANVYIHWPSVYEGLMYRTRPARWGLCREVRRGFAMMAWGRSNAGRGPYLCLLAFGYRLYRSY